MVYGKSVFSHLRNYVVPVDVSAPAHRPVIKFRMEIFIAHKHV